MKKTIKKFISLILCMLVAFSSLSCVAVAGYTTDYPQGVTAEEALVAIEGTDKLLNYILPSLTGGNLGDLVKPMIYSDESLSEFIVSFYLSFSETASEMNMIGLDTSVATVASGLGDYPDVQNILMNASSWEEVKLEGVKWGVSDKNSYATAVAKALAPFNEIFNMLLCSGTYKIARYIKVEGANGYENSILPLLQALKCTDLLSQEEFTNQAEKDRSNIIKNILLPIFSMLENGFDSPMATLTDILPSIAYFIRSGEMNACMDTLLVPIYTNPFVEFAVFLKILDLETMKFDMEEILTTGISDMTEKSGLQLAPIDLERLSQCGEYNASEFRADKSRTLVEILRWLIDSLKLNKENLPQLMKDMGGDESNISTEMLSGLLDNDTDKIVATIILLFTPAKLNAPEMMLYPEIAQTIVQFTPNLTEENYIKVLDEIDDLLDDFVREGGNYRSIEALLSTSIYTNANINAVLTGIYGAMEKEGLLDALGILGVDASPKGVAKLLEKEYPDAYSALIKADSWAKFPQNISWGFYNGSRKGFQNAFLAILRPLNPLLKVVLAGEDIVIADSITFKGADGYNTAVIPILEALGCEENSIKTYSQYVSDNSQDALLNNIADPVFDLLDELFDNPVKTLTRILPNVVYFLNSGSLEKCISNLLIPVTALTSRVSGIVDVELDTSALTKELDFNKLLGGMLEGSGMKIAEFDINSLSGIGTKTERQSKATFNGSVVSYSYIEADRTGVLLTLLRVLAKTLKLPGNENLLVGTMASGNDTFSTYSTSIGEQFQQMTEDEIIEWLYNLLFKERVKVEIVVDEEYNPTIIYKEPEKNYTPFYFVGGFAFVSAVIGVILFCNRKRLYY